MLLTGAGAVTGSQALPNRWTKPVISSAILPVHAVGTGMLTFECAAQETNEAISEVFTPGAGTLHVFLGNILTEADSGTPVNVALSSEIDITEANNYQAETFVEGDVIPGAGGLDFEVNSAVPGNEMTVSYDIGQDGTIDCTFTFSIPEPGP